jgi:hypothetical protein
MATVLSPVAAREFARHAPAERHGDLRGRRIALVWNGKQNGETALRCVEEALRARVPDLTASLIRIPYGIPEETVAHIKGSFDAAVASTGD